MLARWLPLTLLIPLVGCASAPPHRSQSPIDCPLENPLAVPAVDREFLWRQIVDAVDNEYRVRREERVRLVGGVPTVGLLETYPRTGSTLLEPWRRDTVGVSEKLLNTLQTVRRTVSVQVTPHADGYLLHVAVYRELEDVNRPQESTVATTSLRHDTSLIRLEQANLGGQPQTLGWIPIGRDAAKEQQLLREILARVATFDPPPLRRHGLGALHGG